MAQGGVGAGGGGDPNGAYDTIEGTGFGRTKLISSSNALANATENYCQIRDFLLDFGYTVEITNIQYSWVYHNGSESLNGIWMQPEEWLVPWYECTCTITYVVY